MSMYVVPYLPDFASTERSSTTTPIYGKLPNACISTDSPLAMSSALFLRFELEEAAFCTLDWGNSELIAAGLSNGTRFHYFR